MNTSIQRYLRFGCAVLAALVVGLSSVARAAPLTNLDGQCQQSERDLNLCADFPDTGVVVEAVTGNNGEFPRIIDGRSWFSYRVTDDGRGYQPSHFDMELLLCVPDLVALVNMALSGPNAEIKDMDPSTGLSYSPNKLVKFDQGVAKGGWQQYNLVFNADAVGVDRVKVAIKAGRQLDHAMILGPGCGRPDMSVSKNCSGQRIKDDGVGDTIESFFSTTVTNTGNVALTDVTLKEQGSQLSCWMVRVAGTDITPLAMPLGSAVAIPAAGSYDGTLDAVDSNGENGGSVLVSLRCQAPQANLVNTLLAQAAASASLTISDGAIADMADQCPLDLVASVNLAKSCKTQRVVERYGRVVVEICPEITVTNGGNERLDNVTVTDAGIAALATGINVGNLLPGEHIRLSDFLAPGADLCYLPGAPNETAVGSDKDGSPVYDPGTASFTNTAEVSARGHFSAATASDSDSATCPLCVPASGE
ncbi:MAG: hypothetical protein R3292_07710 [Alcanivorax sp.]|nr:hypothetical protein [Alcanivorax sp.]